MESSAAPTSQVRSADFACLRDDLNFLYRRGTTTPSSVSEVVSVTIADIEPYLRRSRLFMRLQSENIKLVTFDEPTSALDPPGAKNLLQRCRSKQQGKTMVFATHHYEHLVEYADLILQVPKYVLVMRGH